MMLVALPSTSADTFDRKNSAGYRFAPDTIIPPSTESTLLCTKIVVHCDPFRLICRLTVHDVGAAPVPLTCTENLSRPCAATPNDVPLPVPVNVSLREATSRKSVAEPSAPAERLTRWYQTLEMSSAAIGVPTPAVTGTLSAISLAPPTQIQTLPTRPAFPAHAHSAHRSPLR